MKQLFTFLLVIYSQFSFSQQPIFEGEFDYNEITDNLTYFPSKDGGLVVVSKKLKGSKYLYSFVHIESSGKVKYKYETPDGSEMSNFGAFELRYNPETNEIFGTSQESGYFQYVVDGNYPMSVSVFKLNSDWNKISVIKNIPHPVIHSGSYIYKNKYTLLGLDASEEKGSYINDIPNNGNYYAITFNEEFTQYKTEKLGFPTFKPYAGKRTNEFIGIYNNKLYFCSNFAPNSDQVTNEIQIAIKVFNPETSKIEIASSVKAPLEKKQLATSSKMRKNGIKYDAYVVDGNSGNLYYDNISKSFYFIGLFGKKYDSNDGIYVVQLNDKMELSKFKTFAAPESLLANKTFKGKGSVIIDFLNVGNRKFILGDLQARASVDLDGTFCAEIVENSELKYFDFNKDFNKANAVTASVFPDKKSTLQSALDGKSRSSFISSGEKAYWIKQTSKGKYQVYLMK